MHLCCEIGSFRRRLGEETVWSSWGNAMRAKLIGQRRRALPPLRALCHGVWYGFGKLFGGYAPPATYLPTSMYGTQDRLFLGRLP